MDTEVTTFRGRRALRCASDALEAVFFTDFGAKLVSLRRIADGHEYLTQGRMDVHPLPEFDSSYVDNDLCGADDMMPSINVGAYPAEPWAGIRLPDHGEVWAIPWTHTEEGEGIEFTTHGIRFPYRFRRAISFATGRTLRFDYAIANLSPFPMPYIWAFHPLFEVEDGARIELPEDVRTVINTLDLHNRLGQVGTIHQWPVTTDKNRRRYDLAAFAADSGVCEKFWAREPINRGEVRLVQPTPGHSLTLRFPPDRVPYVGIWKNQGGVMGQNNVSIEPATGALDDLSVSTMFGRNGTLPARGTIAFWLEIEVQSATVW